MMKKLLLILLTPFMCMAQDHYDDAQLWAHVNVEKKLGDKFILQLSLKGRATNNMMAPGRSSVNFGFGYKFSKSIKVVADYGYIKKLRSNGSYRTYNRANLSLFLKKEVGYWSFIYRNRLQARAKELGTDKDNYNLYFYDRNKLTIKYDATKRFSFYVFEEVYIPLNDPQFFGISRLRSRLGTLINITRTQQLEFYFMYQQQLQPLNWYDQDISYPNTPLKRYFVYGIGYNIEF